MGSNGGVRGVTNAPTDEVASGRWSVREVFRAVKDSSWPVNLEAFFADLSIGDAAYDGFYAGIIDTTQSGAIDAADDYQTPLRYALIVAPQSLEDSSKTWRTSNATVSGASTRWNGLAAQNALASATYPAFNYCEGLSFPSDGGSKWYLPALDELELAYRHFKPTTGTNTTGARDGGAVFPAVNWDNGENDASDPQGSAYTASVPAQTSLNDWQSGNAQAFASPASYWLASWRDSSNAHRVSTASGSQIYAAQTSAYRVRPVRRVVL
jgi:hypothetical protein